MWKLLAGGALIGMGLVAVRLARLIHRGRAVVETARPFVRHRRDAQRVLVIGDSSAVGVGASHPDRSAAGLLAEHWPLVAVGNVGKIGSRTADVARLLRRLQRRVGASRYEALIIHTGGNDILRFTSLTLLRQQLRDVIAVAPLVARHVVVVTGGNMALAPCAFFPLNLMWGGRCRQVRKLFAREMRCSAVSFVDLFRERDVCPTTADPPRYFAADGLHPSDANYALWAEHIIGALESSKLSRSPSSG